MSHQGKIVEVSNDIESGFYFDDDLFCQCSRDELDVILRELGYTYEFRENYNIEKFPHTLKETEE